MSVLITPESPRGQEMAKWEMYPQPWAPVPGRPFNQVKSHFPFMLYKAVTRPDGRVSVGETDDALCGNFMGAAEAFNKRCQKIVHSEAEMEQALHDGWRKDQREALGLEDAIERAVAREAANRAYHDARMSKKAQKEAAEADAATPFQVASVPEKPRRGRPRKIKAE